MSEETDGDVFILATQGGITLVGNIAGKALGFLFVAIATRLVTPTEYGVFTLALSLVTFVQGFAGLNIYRSVDYFIPQFLSNSEYGKAKQALYDVFLIGTATSVVGALAVYLTRNQIGSVFNESLLLVVLVPFVFLIPLQTLNRTLLACFNSIKNMKFRVLVKNIINPLIRIVAAVALVASGAGVLGLVGGYLLGLVVAVLFGGLFLIKEADWLRSSSAEQVSTRSLVSYSLPLVLAGVIYALVGQIDYFAIGFFLNTSDVGQYRVAFLLAANLLIVLSAITPVFKPIVAENRTDSDLLESRYQLTTRWVTMLTLPLALTLILAPELYLSLLFTEAYTEASAAVVALSIGYLLNSSFGPEGMILEGLGHTRLTLLNTFILVSTNGVLDILLVPRLGILGAGIATGAALTIAGFAGVIEIYYLRRIVPVSMDLFRVWIAALGPLGIGWYLVHHTQGLIVLILLPILVIVVYLIGLRTVGGFSKEDAELAKRIDEQLGYSIATKMIGY